MFAGAVWSDAERPLSRDLLGAMLAVRGGEPYPIYHVAIREGLAHRPIPGVAMGYCRSARATRTEEPPLSSPNYRHGTGVQPVVLDDGALVGVFDGCLDNRIELQRRLDGRGVQLRLGSDAEMLLYLFRDEGPRCFSLLHGNFSAAIWDADHQRLVLARDPWGTVPLYYRADSQTLIFASRLRALIPAMPGELALDAAACDEYLTYGFVPAPHCLIESVKKLPGGYVAIYRNERLDFHRFWDPAQEVIPQRRMDRGGRAKLADLPHALTTTIRRQMGAGNSPVVVWLRGGVVSAVLASVASRIAPQQVRAVSLGASGDAHDPCQQIAQVLGIAYQHHVWQPPTVDDLQTLVADCEEPLAGGEAWAWRYLARQLGDEECRMLDATGAAELLRAHPRYAQCRAWSDLLPPWLHRLLAPKDARRQDEWQLRHKTLPPFQQRRYLGSIAIFNESQRAAMYRPEHLGCLPDADPFDLLRFAFHRVSGQNAVNCFALVDLATLVPGRQVAAMASGIAASGAELRLPFLDPTVVSAAWAATRDSHPTGHGAKTLRRALKPLLPRSLHCPTLDEVPSPVSGWLRNELREGGREILTSDSARIGQFASPQAVANLWEQHLQGRRDHGARLWSLLMLELWLGQYSLRQPQPAVTTSVESGTTIG